MTEIQRYEVLESHPGFELRSYPEHITVSMVAPGSFSAAGFGAFRYLANYISGGNQQAQSIAMTAPVLQKKQPGGYEVAFVMPADMTTAPQPQSSLLELHKNPGSLMAAIRFSGLASDELFEKKEAALRKLCEKHNLKVISEPLYARYNGPWTPAPFRRNEVLLQVERERAII